jgi:hypothetical protein
MSLYLSSDLLFDTIVTVLYKPSPFIHKLAQDTLESYHKEKAINDGLNAPILVLYASILHDILEQRLTNQDKSGLQLLYAKYLGSEVIQKHPYLLDVLQNLFNNNISEAQFSVIASRMKNSVIYQKGYKYLRTMFNKLTKCGNSNDIYVQEAMLDEVKQIVNEMQQMFGESHTDANANKTIDHLDFSNKDNIRKVITKFKKQKGAFVFKTGLQALNRMLGEPGGLVLGHSIVFGACSHNYKSSMLLSLIKWIAKYNNTPDDNDGKAPTIWFISLENEVDENLMIWYKQIYRELNPDIGDKPIDQSDEEIVEFVYEFFNKAGWRIIIDRRLGASYGMNDYIADYEQYEREGCRIYLSAIDYLSKMKKDENYPEHLGIRALYNGMCNYIKNKGTTLATAHQLTREAMALRRQPNAIKKFTEVHLGDSLGPYQEPDIVLWLNICKSQHGHVFLEAAFGKNRYFHNTPESHKYAAWKFGKYLLPDDLLGKDTSFTNIYSEDEPDENNVLVTEQPTQNIFF